MDKNDRIVSFKIIYTLVWVLLASYYLSWGANERTVTAPIDESGWIPDGGLASMVERAGPVAQEQTED